MKMSGHRVHLIAYLATVILAHYVLNGVFGFDLLYWTGLAGLLIGGLYSLLPDIDCSSSKIRVLVTGLLSAAALLTLTFDFLTKSGELSSLSLLIVAVLFLLWLTKHRGALHTPAAGIVFSAPLLFAGPHFFIMGLYGYLMHLLLDGRLLG
jgi:hypothetical protein